MNNAVTNAQLAKFEQLWQETCDLWPPPGFGYKLHASSKKDWNIIAVPHVDDWKSLIPVIEVIGEQWSWNKPYTLSQLHITLAGLGDTINWREKENELKSILDEITTDQDPIKIEFRGLNILRNTIIAQAIDVNGELTKLIAQLSKQIKKKKYST